MICLDSEVLAASVNPRHLSPHALHAHRLRYTTHPLRMLVVDDFLADPDPVARFLASDRARFEKDHALYDEHHVSAAKWDNASPSDRFYRYGVLRLDESPADPDGARFWQLRQAVVSSPWLRFFEVITGCPLGVAETPVVHSTGPQDSLRPHNDRSLRRRVALILYLTPDWDPAEQGGALRITSGYGITNVECVYNRLVMFDVDAHWGHYVTPVLGPTHRLGMGWWIADP